MVDKDDYDAMYSQYRNAVAGRGGYATEGDFRVVLSNVAAGNPDPALDEDCDQQIANALLQYMDGADRLALQDEYQRLLFGGSTVNEVWMCPYSAFDKSLVGNQPLTHKATRSSWRPVYGQWTRPPTLIWSPLYTSKLKGHPPHRCT